MDDDKQNAKTTRDGERRRRERFARAMARDALGKDHWDARREGELRQASRPPKTRRRKR